MFKSKKITIPFIILFVLILITYLAYTIYPNAKNILDEAYVTCGAINLLSSEGYMT